MWTESLVQPFHAVSAKGYERASQASFMANLSSQLWNNQGCDAQCTTTDPPAGKIKCPRIHYLLLQTHAHLQNPSVFSFASHSQIQGCLDLYQLSFLPQFSPSCPETSKTRTISSVICSLNSIILRTISLQQSLPTFLSCFKKKAGERWATTLDPLSMSFNAVFYFLAWSFRLLA